jgi:23S rRNA (cytosine1962-C5)-methyltransferase
MNYTILSLKKQQERRLQAGHLWIYSNEIDTNLTPLKNFSAGELVFVTNHHGGKIGIAYINPQTLLSARVLTRHNQEEINVDFFIKRIKHALQLRETLFEKPFYRLIFGESDGLPGLVVDRFDDTLVGQINTAGMEKLTPLITEALISVIHPKHILWRNDSSYRTVEGLTEQTTVGYGAPPELCLIEENNTLFHAPIFDGQKTGWFTIIDLAVNESVLMQKIKKY